MSETRKSAVRIVKRAAIPNKTAYIIRGLAVVLALATGGLFILALGHNPFEVYKNMITGSLGTKSALRETVKMSIPLCITALGITLAFKMKFWNIGGEGQICIGATAATYFALFHYDWPPYILFPVMVIASMVAGGIWGMIPAMFKAKFGTNETLFTLMLNYVASYFIQYLRMGPWMNPESAFPQIARFEKSARLPLIFGVHAGWIFALVLVVLVFIYLKYTKQGYEISVVGENENTARYAGMNVPRIIIRTAFLSAAICGLAGMLQATGADKTLSEAVSGGAGFTAITIAWLSKLNPFAILLVSFLFGMLEKGSGTIQSLFNISTSAADVFQGIILFFVLGSEFFINFRVFFGKGGGKHER